MIYGGSPPKIVAPATGNCNTQTMGFHGPGPYTYGLIAKQPGSDYKIRIRDMERMRLENHRMQNEHNFKNIIRHGQHIQMLDVADKKYLCKQIQRMVDDEMKAHEHLFVEECPKQKLIPLEEKEPPKPPKISDEEKQKILDEAKKKKDEEERIIVEEKRLQHFIENSNELRTATINKRKKEIADHNYKIIQEREMKAKEQKLKKREEANLENAELFKSQIHEKIEKKRNILEQKQQFRNELQKQLVEIEIVREKEKELKNIERHDFIKFKEKLDEEEELEKLKRIKTREHNKDVIAKFVEERMQLFAKSNEIKPNTNDTFTNTVLDEFNRNAAECIEAKVQLRRENEMFLKHQAMIKEERRKHDQEMRDTLMKQIKEIDELKTSKDRENDESRRKRLEAGNKVLMEQLREREALAERQKEIKRNAIEELVKDRENIANEQKQLCEQKMQSKWQISKELNDQINDRKLMMEKQKKIELENHRKYLTELAKQEELLQKLLKQV